MSHPGEPAPTIAQNIVVGHRHSHMKREMHWISVPKRQPHDGVKALSCQKMARKDAAWGISRSLYAKTKKENKKHKVIKRIIISEMKSKKGMCRTVSNRACK